MNMTDISGIGDATAQRLKAHGIDSVEAVARAATEQLVAVPGIGAGRAAALRQSAIRLLSHGAVAETDDKPKPAGDEAKRRKDKKGRKDKKKDKKRQGKVDKKLKKKKKKEKKADKRDKKGKNKRK